jgi:hypothetical protein
MKKAPAINQEAKCGRNTHIPRGILLVTATDVNMIIGISKEGQTKSTDQD